MDHSAKKLLLLTNDDGIDAPGMQALVAAAAQSGHCRVIAPCGPVSGCGHRVTTHGPITINALDEERIAVDGTPVDCVRLALHALAPDVSWVLSGINAGGNLGTDVYHSGTVAAVREAAIRGVPGIALSQYIARGQPIDWAQTATWAARVIKTLMALPWEQGTFWNVNLPHPPAGIPEPEISFCPLDPSPLPIDYRLESNRATYTGNYQMRLRHSGSDIAVCFGGQISVSSIRCY
jgi:5'-nucleotidase